MEIWKQIENYPKFEASTLGRVRSVKHKRIRKPHLDTSGYFILSIPNITGKQAGIKVHKLISKTFLGQDKALVVDHINGIRTDNRIENLRLVTQKENMMNKPNDRYIFQLIYKTIKFHEEGKTVKEIKELL